METSNTIGNTMLITEISQDFQEFVQELPNHAMPRVFLIESSSGDKTILATWMNQLDVYDWDGLENLDGFDSEASSAATRVSAPTTRHLGIDQTSCLLDALPDHILRLNVLDGRVWFELLQVILSCTCPEGKRMQG